MYKRQDPQEAKEFVERTGVSSLAVAIGTAHGFYVGTPVLDKPRVSAIKEVVDVPLVLHGASGLSEEDVRECVELSLIHISLMLANDIILHYEKKDVADDAVSIVVPGATVYLPLEDLVDFEQERERLKKEEERLNSEIKRAQGMLANERFTSKAPADKVQAERDKLEKYTKMLEQVKERIDSLR